MRTLQELREEKGTLAVSEKAESAAVSPASHRIFGPGL